MTVRLWKSADVQTVAEMERRCFQDPWSETELACEHLNPYCHCYLAEEGGQVCGYCCLFVLFEDAEVHNIAVDIPHRKKGVGELLLTTMHEKAKALGAQTCFLEVRESNAAAIALYSKHGYTRYGERKKYYPDGETAVLMKKVL